MRGRGRVGAWLVAAVCLASACQAGTASAPKRLATAPPATPALATSPPVGPAPPAAARRLVKPDHTVSLSGTALLDARYLVTAGVGIVSNNGGSVIANNGAGLISDNGGGVISPHGGGIVSNNGGSLIAEGGLNLVGTGQSALLSEGGGALVAAGGGSLTSHNGTGYRLAQAVALPAPGTVLPTAGLRLSVLSLTTNTPLPVGQDSAGHLVYTIYTDERGHYELYLPADEARNVRLVANLRVLPGATNPLADPDPRLRYDIVGQAGDAANVDEDAQILSQLLLEGFTSRLRPILTSTTTDWTQFVHTNFSNFSDAGSSLELLAPILQQLAEASRANGIDKAPPEVVSAVARRIAERALAGIDLSSVEVEAKTLPYYSPDNLPGDHENALVALKQIYGNARTHAARYLPPQAGDYLRQQSFFTNAVCDHLIAPDFAFEKAADLGSFITQAFLTRDGFFFDKLGDVLDSVDANRLPATIHAPGSTQADRLEACALAVQKQMLETFAGRTDEAVAYLQQHAYKGPPAAPVAPAPTCEP